MEEIRELVKAANYERLRELLSEQSRQLLNNRDEEKGFSLLHVAVRCSGRIPEKREDYLLVVRELIRFGANVNTVDYNEITPLHFAVRYRDVNMVKCLLENGAFVDLQDRKRFTALHFACNIPYNHSSPPSLDLKVVKLLIRYRAIPDIQNIRGETPLMIAVKCNHYKVVRELLNNEASPNIRDCNGNSPMHFALARLDMNMYIVEDLFRHGAMFTLPNYIDVTPLRCYLHKLQHNTTPIEMKKAKRVFRLFGLMYGLMRDQLHVLDNIALAREQQLPEYIETCLQELIEMKRDVLKSNFSVFDLTMCGVFYIYRTTEYRSTSIEVLDEVLAKLMEGQYPEYSVWIVEGVCRPYMSERFALTCSDLRRMKPYLLNYLEFSLLSEYLTNFDMLNMMIACRNASPSSDVFSTQAESCPIS